MKKPLLPTWDAGVWYDPSILPNLDQGYANTGNNKLVSTLCERSWDLISKSYKPETDTFIYRRHANHILRVDHSNKTKVWKFDLSTDNFRIVAIMPHPIWQEVYETRLTGKDFNFGDSSDLPLHAAIDRALGTPSDA